MNGRALCIALLTLAAAVAADARAQATQVVEDGDLGLRFSIPKGWEWRSRDRDVFVDCKPGTVARPKGPPGCWFTVSKSRIAPGQTSITDADRAKWKGWTVANGTRPLISARDLRVAGYPAHEIVVRTGTERGAPRTVRVFVLMPEFGVVDTWLHAAWDDQDHTASVEPAFRAALESLKRAK